MMTTQPWIARIAGISLIATSVASCASVSTAEPMDAGEDQAQDGGLTSIKDGGVVSTLDGGAALAQSSRASVAASALIPKPAAPEPEVVLPTTRVGSVTISHGKKDGESASTYELLAGDVKAWSVHSETYLMLVTLESDENHCLQMVLTFSNMVILGQRFSEGTRIGSISALDEGLRVGFRRLKSEGRGLTPLPEEKVQAAIVERRACAQEVIKVNDGARKKWIMAGKGKGLASSEIARDVERSIHGIAKDEVVIQSERTGSKVSIGTSRFLPAGGVATPVLVKGTIRFLEEKDTSYRDLAGMK